MEENIGSHKFTDFSVVATNVADKKATELVSTANRRNRVLTCGVYNVETY